MGTIENENNCGEDMAASCNDNNKENSALVLHSPSPILPLLGVKKFESDVLKKQTEYSNKITDLEGRLASFHSRLAIECAEREREHSNTLEQYVDGPLEQVISKSLQKINVDLVLPVMHPSGAANATCTNNEGESDTTSKSLPNLVSIERKINHLEAQMNHHKHVTLFHSTRQNFDAIDKECHKTVQPDLSLEFVKADKRDGGITRRFESSAGEYTRLVSELQSSRVSSLGYVEKKINDWDASFGAEQLIEEIQKLKQRVLGEREERIRQDEIVVDKMINTKKMLEEDIFLTC